MSDGVPAMSLHVILDFPFLFHLLLVKRQLGRHRPSFVVFFSFFLGFPCFSSIKVIAGMSVSAQERSSSHRGGSPVFYPPPSSVDTYIRDHRYRFDTLQFAALQSR